ncbi:IS110 family transposase (plasmid) [Alicyclobacillus fastidiosus]|uniref:IS110 family transposase n=1 Tax=Alicyclobacillus fastidiosus TaxID=392011 RepID=A0ABY6ZPK0_9BACL|nr:IS110 family transposase [Alicyclobacillus fastidiosus]WAH44772.1 IS110 family transposase [Alicyclobacillus fastidiosus]GMA65605.1 IS110 family transposase [Alicyclobacillus fastidiosus]GMA65721.1 IS110 family transposase [Alicyclobacillus fastidiosus]
MFSLKCRPYPFDNSRHGFEKLLTWIESLKLDHGCDQVIVGVEPTGHYWMNLAQFLRHRGISVVLVNPMHVKKSKELDDNSPTKNDRKDARVISQLAKDGRYSVPNIPEDIYAELRVGMNQRGRLVEDLKRVQGRIHNWLDRFFPEFTKVFKDWEGKSALVCLHLFPLPTDVVKETEIEVVRKWRENGIKRGVGVSRARQLIKAATDSIGIIVGLQMARQELHILLGQYDLLHAQLAQLVADIEQLVSQVPGAEQMMSVPGIGLVTAAGFIAEVGDISSYQHPRQIQKLAGLNLKENSSGNHKGRTTISKRGRPKLRALLFRCVIPLIAKNAEFQGLHQYFTQRPQNPLKKVQSVVALCCKLIRILFVLWKRQVPYDPKQMLGPVQEERLQNAA